MVVFSIAIAALECGMGSLLFCLRTHPLRKSIMKMFIGVIESGNYGTVPGTSTELRFTSTTGTTGTSTGTGVYHRIIVGISRQRHHLVLGTSAGDYCFLRDILEVPRKFIELFYAISCKTE